MYNIREMCQLLKSMPIQQKGSITNIIDKLKSTVNVNTESTFSQG